MLVIGTSAALVWAVVLQEPIWGWAMLVGLLLLALADWALLALLPQQGLSYGAVQPPLLALAVLRGALVVLAAPLAAQWLLPVGIGLFTVQILIWLLLAYGTLIEPFRIQVTHIAIPNQELGNPVPPLRIVQLSDVHVERLTKRDLSLPALVAGLSPDLIVLTGDFLSTSYNRDPRAVADLVLLLEQLHAPGGIYAVWGTKDVDRPEILRPAMEGLGIVVLEDQAQEVEVAGRHIWLMGVSPTRDLAADADRLANLVAAAPVGIPRLLLYHTPDLMPEAAALGVDLYLAGHTHGGQWRLPGFGAILTSSRYWKRYEAGLYRQAKTHMYVSRGLGLEGFGAPRARFFCRPEVVSVSFGGQASLTVAGQAVDCKRGDP